MLRFILILIISLLASLGLRADNSVRILPDSTNKLIQIEISRHHASVYQVRLEDEKKNVFYKSSAKVESTPNIISIDWSFCKPGFYYVILENKKETVRLLFIKKEG